MFAPFHSDGRSGGKDKIKMPCPYIFLIKQIKIQGACMFAPFHSEGRSGYYCRRRAAFNFLQMYQFLLRSKIYFVKV
jgi:hypothetical protein